MPNTYSALYTHFVFSTKHRQPLIEPIVRPKLFAYMGGVCKKLDCALVAAGGVADHVHVLVRRHPSRSESEVVGKIKSNSSRWMKGTVRGFSWQDGGGAFSVGPGDLEKVRAYLARQEEHHWKESFQSEYLRFLKKYKIEYDPRWVLE